MANIEKIIIRLPYLYGTLARRHHHRQWMALYIIFANNMPAELGVVGSFVRCYKVKFSIAKLARLVFACLDQHLTNPSSLIGWLYH